MQTAPPKPMVSVLICAYNGERFIERTLGSALAQTFTDYEVVVVDDGSTDSTFEILTRFADRIRVVRQENGGIANARNAGLAEARGTWVALLDHDDLWDARKLETQVALLGSQPTHVMAYSTARVVNAAGKLLDPIGSGPDPGLSMFDSLVIRNRVPALTAVFRLSVAREIGGFRQAMAPSDDRDMWLRLAQIGSIAFDPKELATFRLHEANFHIRNQARVLSAAEAVVLEYLGEVSSEEVRRRALYELACVAVGVWSRSNRAGRVIGNVAKALSLRPLARENPRMVLRAVRDLAVAQAPQRASKRLVS